MLHTILDGGLRISLKKLMLMFTVVVFVVAIATTYVRMIASRPNLYYEIDVEFSKNYSPPVPKDMALTIYEMVPDTEANELALIEEQIGNGDLRIYTYRTNSCKIVAAGKSWRTSPQQIETIARATADAVTLIANHEGITASIMSEMKTKGLSHIPITVLSEMDRTKP